MLRAEDGLFAIFGGHENFKSQIIIPTLVHAIIINMFTRACTCTSDSERKMFRDKLAVRAEPKRSSMIIMASWQGNRMTAMVKCKRHLYQQ